MRLSPVLPVATVLISTAAVAASDTKPLLDYRDAAFRERRAEYPASERERITRALAGQSDLRQEMGETFVILGDARGAFSRAGASARVFLVQTKAPLAIEPFPDAPAPVLVVLVEGGPPGFFRLPKDVQYQRLVGAADADRDGRDEVLLESSFMNMGSFVTTVTAARLDPTNASAAPVQVLQNVVADACDAASGRKSLSAATVTLDAHGKLKAQKHTMRCR